MSEIIAAPPMRTQAPHAPPTLGLARTLSWGLFALFVMTGGFYPEAAQLLSWPPLPRPIPLSLFTWDILRIAAFGAIVLAISRSAWCVPEYLGLVWPEKKVRKLSQKYVGGLAFAIVILWSFVSLWVDGMLPASGSISRIEALARDHWILILLSLWIVGVVVNPVLDELMFRGFLYRGLAVSPIGPVGAILVTSLSFGLAKKVGGAGWDWMMLQSVLGLVFGWWRWRTGNVTGPILAHASMNAGVAFTITVMGAVFYFLGND